MLIHQIMERQTWLFRSVQSESSFQAFGNVNVVGKGHAINQMGSSALAAILNAAALLLKLSTGWDWFINLVPQTILKSPPCLGFVAKRSQPHQLY